MVCLKVAVAVPFALLSFAMVGCSSTAEIEPQADSILRAMSATLAGARSLSYETKGTVEVALETGQIVQYSGHRKIRMRRPNKLAMDVKGALGERRAWYNGRVLSVLNVTDKLTAQLKVPANVDDMLDFVLERFDMTIPLSDVLYTNPYKVLTENVKTGEYVGTSQIEGHDCHHLVFQQEWIQWQVWIDAGDVPVPRKVVITDLGGEGKLQFSAVLTAWNLSADLADKDFEPDVPADAEKVDMDELLGFDIKGRD
jgi:hypothetical protein